ncbi:MAG: hypothetical protein ACK55X_14445 [Synechococcaceae cyanobacterium]
MAADMIEQAKVRRRSGDCRQEQSRKHKPRQAGAFCIGKIYYPENPRADLDLLKIKS